MNQQQTALSCRDHVIGTYPYEPGSYRLERTEGMAFLTAGMMVFWLANFIFVISVMRRQRSLEEELEVLRELLDQER